MSFFFDGGVEDEPVSEFGQFTAPPSTTIVVQLQLTAGATGLLGSSSPGLFSSQSSKPKQGFQGASEQPTSNIWSLHSSLSQSSQSTKPKQGFQGASAQPTFNFGSPQSSLSQSTKPKQGFQGASEQPTSNIWSLHSSLSQSSQSTKPKHGFQGASAQPTFNVGSPQSSLSQSTKPKQGFQLKSQVEQIKDQQEKQKQSSKQISEDFVIPDELLKKAAILSKWVRGDELCVFPYRNPFTENIDSKSDFAPCEANLHFLKTPDILSDPELRKLVNESQAIFFASRNVSPDENPKYRTVERSREHRSAIRVCMEEMHQAMKRNPKVNYEEWICVLENIEIIWHLCELLYLDVVQSDVVLPKLLQWTRLSSVEYDEVISQELRMGKGADLRSKERYWSQVMALLVESRFDSTRALLRLHSEADSKPFMEADALLRALPIYSLRCGLSPAEFNARWRSWKSTVRSKISTGAFVSYPELLDVMTILGSAEPLFKLLKPHCHTWYQMLTAVVQFTDPMVRTHELSFHAKKCIEHYGGEDKLNLLDQTLLALMDGNLASAIAKLLLTADSGLSAVHLANLLQIRGCFNKSAETTVQLEPLLLKYGLLLMSHKRFWQIGLSYLKWCPNDGKDAIAIQLSSIPLKDDKTILKIIHAAADNRLRSVVNSICRTVSMQHIKQGNLGNALTWALMSKDVEILSEIADKYLYKYSTGSSEKELNCQNVLAGLGQSVFISSRLTFLCKYCDFHKCYQKGEVKEAAAIIIRLLDSKISPKYFWFTLLLDALPILEMKGSSHFSHDDCTILLASLEELAIGWIDNPVKKPQNFNEQIRTIRLAIIKRLAKTLLQTKSQNNSNVITCY